MLTHEIHWFHVFNTLIVFFFFSNKLWEEKKILVISIDLLQKEGNKPKEKTSKEKANASQPPKEPPISFLHYLSHSIITVLVK